jgi:hypothetical protein
VYSFRMEIFVRSPTGRTVCLRVQPSDTLHMVNAKILEQHRVFAFKAGLNERFHVTVSHT